MAVQDGYGKSSGSESLVFAYDLKDTVNSFRGEPATNLVATIASYYGGNVSTSYANGQYQTSAIVINGIDNTVPSGNYSQFSGTTTDTNSQTYWTIQGNSVVNESNQTVSFSVYLKGSGTCHLATYNDQCCYQVGPDITLTNTWTRYSITKTISTFSDYHWVAVRGITTSTNVFISSAQWERNSHSTPFITSSRSNTQGLLDLTGNNTINLSNVSFDSNAKMVFDGTNDYVITSNFPQLSNWTTEVLLKPSVYTSAQKVILDVNVGIRFEISNGFFNSHFGNGNGWIYTNLPSTTPIEANKWFHVTVTVQSGGQAKVYVNGVLENSINIGSGTTPNIPLYIGRYTGTSGYEFNGDVSIVKIYNRTITSTEITNNYLKYKRQYGLT